MVTINPDRLVDDGARAYAAGAISEASRLFRSFLACSPADGYGWSNLGLALQGRAEKHPSLVAHDRAVVSLPGEAVVHFNAAIAAQRFEAPARAVRALRRALSLSPAFAGAISELGLVGYRFDHPHAAIVVQNRAIAVAPSLAIAWQRLGAQHKVLGDAGSARRMSQRAIALTPSWQEALNNLANLPADAATPSASTLLLRALACALSAPVLINLARSLQDTDQSELAASRLRSALALDPASADAHNALGNISTTLAEVPDGLVRIGRALALRPDLALADSNRLLFLSYLDRVDPYELLAAHRAWAARHVPRSPPLRHAPVARHPDPIRVGLVSADLGRHVVGRQLATVAECLDPAAIALSYYDNRPREDDIARRLKTTARSWRTIAGKTDADVAGSIRDDGIEVLIDLSGHTAGNRLTLFGLRPAPVQATWLGYPGTLGIEEIDFRLADPFLAPPGSDAHYVEKILRLPETYTCYTPPADAPPPGPLPALANGYVTFGAFNNPAKLSPRALWAMATILERLPMARLHFRYMTLAVPSVRDRILAAFSARGIDVARLSIDGRVPAHRYWKSYDEVDIALDPFPHSGATSSFESLWMGLPVVTRVEDSFVSRQTYAILRAVGGEATAAETDDGYIGTALSLASDLDALARQRSTLRGRVLASALCQPERFAQALEAAIREMRDSVTA